MQDDVALQNLWRGQQRYVFIPRNRAAMKACLNGLQVFARPNSCYCHIRRNVVTVARSAVQATCRPKKFNSSVSAAKLQFGQPLHETHPHLLKSGERELLLLDNSGNL